MDEHMEIDSPTALFEVFLSKKIHGRKIWSDFHLPKKGKFVHYFFKITMQVKYIEKQRLPGRFISIQITASPQWKLFQKYVDKAS